MEFTQYILPNGIRCIHKKVSSGVVNCAMTINTGSRDELTTEHGMAHLLEHSFFKGTKHRKAFHINCRLENLGGELNAYTTKEETVVHATTLKGDFAKAAELISDVIFNSTFPTKEIDKEKIIIIDEINSYKDNPTEMIYDDFEDLIFAGSSLGHNILGRKNSLNKLNREHIIDFVARTYNTSQMVFSAIGNISEKRFIEICNRYFADIEPSERHFQRDTPPLYAPFNKNTSRGCHQAHCIIGNRAYSLSSDKRAALSLLTNILGGPSANSMLNMAIRERNGLSYSIESSFYPFSDTGIATIYFGTDKEHIDQCIDLVNKELAILKNKPLSKRVLGIAKKQFIGQLTISMESNEGYMLSAARSYMFYNSVDSMDKIRDKVLSITEYDMQEVANEIYGNELSTLIYR